MAVELAGISLEHLTHVAVREQTRIVHHPVPGLEGDLAQVLGRPSVVVSLAGILYGPTLADDLKQLRAVILKHEPVDFFTETVGEGYFAQVLISKFEVVQQAGFLDRFEFRCEVVEYVKPPEPAAPDLLGALDSSLLDEAAGFMDDVQNALDQVSQLTDLIANVPSFGDPTEGLSSMLDSFTGATGGGVGALNDLLALFKA